MLSKVLLKRVCNCPYEVRSCYNTIAKRIIAKCSDGDIRAALRLLTTNDSVADKNEETIRALREKHPTSTNTGTLPADQQDIQPL